MTSSREKFQQLLGELFQFDCTDLDFGIYLIMNYKRDVIEKFIIQDLDRGALAEGADEVFVNGDSFIPIVKTLDPVFKARMIAEVQA